MPTQRVVLVTGGMGGIGSAISSAMARKGYSVSVTYSPRNSAHAEWIANKEAEGLRIVAESCDVADLDSCARTIAAVEARLGPIDILINNAGITRDSTLRKMDAVNWNLVMRTNLDSLFNVTKHVVEGMTQRQWGRIINISSINGSKGAFGQTNYAASKAGVHGFTKALALEVARKNVTVNTISPGYIATKMVTSVPQEILNTSILPSIPMGRLGTPEEVAELVAYLASDAAGFITGANIAINGGQHMQ